MEEVLRDFVGTILFVSHDRYLINALATQVWIIAQGQLRVYKGDYQEYLARREREQEAARLEAARQDALRQEQKRRQQAKRRADPHSTEGRSLDEIEGEIACLESKLETLGERLVLASTKQELDRVRVLGVEYARVELDLEDLLTEWTAQGERAEEKRDG
jgi:ATP-binding cassette subfamily F protein 3